MDSVVDSKISIDWSIKECQDMVIGFLKKGGVYLDGFLSPITKGILSKTSWPNAWFCFNCQIFWGAWERYSCSQFVGGLMCIFVFTMSLVFQDLMNCLMKILIFLVFIYLIHLYWICMEVWSYLHDVLINSWV